MDYASAPEVARHPVDDRAVRERHQMRLLTLVDELLADGAVPTQAREALDQRSALWPE